MFCVTLVTFFVFFFKLSSGVGPQLASFRGNKEVFVFSTNKNNWKFYNWDKLTTIVEFGYHDEEMVRYAHVRNKKVVTVANFAKEILKNTDKIEAWIDDVVNEVHYRGLDGVNIDFEDEILCNDDTSRRGFTFLMRSLKQKLMKYDPHSQLSIDFAWSPRNIDNRCYDYISLSSIADIIFIMSYDQRSQIRGECKAWANADYQQTLQGLRDYIDLGVPSSKMVLGVPWYGYHYECLRYVSETNTCIMKEVPFRNVSCSDAAGQQVGYTDILLMSQSSDVEIINLFLHPDALSLCLTYKLKHDVNVVHQLWFDNGFSLSIKYLLATSLDLKGVGFWEADSLRYDTSLISKMSVKEMWNGLP